MKKIWWWIIGIAAFLLVGTLLLVGFGIFRFAHMPMIAVGDHIRTFDRFDGVWSPRSSRMDLTWGFPFGGILGGLLMFALPLGIIALIVAGIVLLVRSSNKPKAVVEPAEAVVCPECGADVLSDWKVCPHCGHSLAEEKEQDK
jgi:hypothetical protein